VRRAHHFCEFSLGCTCTSDAKTGGKTAALEAPQQIVDEERLSEPERRSLSLAFLIGKLLFPRRCNYIRLAACN